MIINVDIDREYDPDGYPILDDDVHMHEVERRAQRAFRRATGSRRQTSLYGRGEHDGYSPSTQTDTIRLPLVGLPSRHDPSAHPVLAQVIVRETWTQRPGGR